MVKTRQGSPEEELWLVQEGYLTDQSARAMSIVFFIIYLVMSLVRWIATGVPSYLVAVVGLSLLVLYSIDGISELYRWLPGTFMVILYDVFYTLRLLLHIPPVTKAIYGLEISLFGWIFEGQPPSFWFYNNHMLILDILCSVVYLTHIVLPVSIIIYVRFERPDKFQTIMTPFFVLGLLANLLFLIFPVAPPWFVLHYGLHADIPPQIPSAISTAGLHYMDQALNTDLIVPIMGELIANKFAAFPSLHVAIPAYLYFMSKYHDLPVKLVLLPYLVLVSFSVIYLNHHWVSDVISGVLLAYLSIKIAAVFDVFDTDE